MTRSVLSPPRRAPWVVVHEPMADGAPWIVERQGANPLRVSADAGELLAAIDGERDAAALACALGTRWTPDLVDEAVRRFSELSLLDDPHAVAPKPERRIVFVSPGMLQFRLVAASRIIEPLRAALVRLRGSVVLALTLALGLGGLISLLAQQSVLGTTLGEPLPLWSMIVIWTGLGLTTVFHELSHAGTLAHYRGRPGWFGFMLFYLTPACFCEVTDSWRLPRPGQRVAVALAGVGSQAAMAGAAAIIALALPAGDGRTTLTGFAVVCYLAGVVNLVPWVKLDGYLALMTWLDIPHLREKAMADARGWWAHRLFGAQFTRTLPRHGWAIPYGMVCAGFPAVVLLLATARWTHMLLTVGVLGGIVVLLLLGLLVFRLVRAVVRLVVSARRSGAGRVKLTAVTVLALAAIAAVLTFVQVPYGLKAGYVSDQDGVHLVVPPGTDLSLLRPGRTVVLQRAGVLVTTELGGARIDAGPARSTMAPTSALMPIRLDTRVQALSIPLRELSGGPLDATGSAYVQGEPVSAGMWLVSGYLTPAWTEVFG